MLFSVLYCNDIGTCDVFGCQSVCAVHQKRMEAMFVLFATSDCHFIAIFNIRSIIICRIHINNARNTNKRHMERRNGEFEKNILARCIHLHCTKFHYMQFQSNNHTGYRATQKRGSKLGEEITMEINSIGFWTLFDCLVLAIHQADNQIKNRSKFLFRLRCWSFFFSKKLFIDKQMQDLNLLLTSYYYVLLQWRLKAPIFYH